MVPLASWWAVLRPLQWSWSKGYGRTSTRNIPMNPSSASGLFNKNNWEWQSLPPNCGFNSQSAAARKPGQDNWASDLKRKCKALDYQAIDSQTIFHGYIPTSIHPAYSWAENKLADKGRFKLSLTKIGANRFNSYGLGSVLNAEWNRLVPFTDLSFAGMVLIYTISTDIESNHKTFINQTSSSRQNILLQRTAAGQEESINWERCTASAWLYNRGRYTKHLFQNGHVSNSWSRIQLNLLLVHLAGRQSESPAALIGQWRVRYFLARTMVGLLSKHPLNQQVGLISISPFPGELHHEVSAEGSKARLSAGECWKLLFLCQFLLPSLLSEPSE